MVRVGVRVGARARVGVGARARVGVRVRVRVREGVREAGNACDAEDVQHHVHDP